MAHKVMVLGAYCSRSIHHGRGRGDGSSYYVHKAKDIGPHSTKGVSIQDAR